MTTIHHDSYQAIVEYDDETGLFHGEIVNLRDVITFQGRSIDELNQAFAESIEDYLAFCRDRREESESLFGLADRIETLDVIPGLVEDENTG